MFCKKCGKEIADDTKFCPSCGTQLDVVENSEIKTDGNVSSKSRLAALLFGALLFGIFLGGIGVHNFYLGHTGKGIAKILMTVFGLIFYIAGIVKLATDSYNYYSSGSIAAFSGLMGFGLIVMWIPGIWAFIEWILIACGKAKDSKGLLVKNWQ